MVSPPPIPRMNSKVGTLKNISKSGVSKNMHPKRVIRVINDPINLLFIKFPYFF